MPDVNGDLVITLPSLSVSAGEPSYLWMSGELTALTSLVRVIHDTTPDKIVSEFPTLRASLHVVTGALGFIDITLGWPWLSDPLSVQLYGGGHIDIDLPALSINPSGSPTPITVLNNALIHLAIKLPKPVMLSGTSQELLGWVDIELPSLTGNTHVFSENIGHISGAIPMPHFLGRWKTGSIGDVAVELPFLYYDSTLLSEGLLDINITLPCFITNAFGHIEDATLTYRTIVMNTMNFGVTEYGALELKGMVDVFGKTIAINANDLISVGPTLDNTEHIDAVMQTGTIDFSNRFFTKPRDIWITLRSGKRIRLTIKDNEVPTQETTYESEKFVEDLKKTRVKLGRGFYSEFFDMTIQNIEGDLVDIKNIHVFSDPSPGRKR